MSVTSEVEWRKKAMTIQPTDCQCLPELTKQILIVAVQENIFRLNNELKRQKESFAKYPALAGSKAYSMSFSAERIEENEVALASHEYLLNTLLSLPSCKGEDKWPGS
jgi:hypothetical protein